MSDIILDVKDLHTYIFSRWGVVKAVDGVSFTVREGETLGIVGESGAGKTITSLSLLRLIPKPAARIVKGRSGSMAKICSTRATKRCAMCVGAQSP